MESFGIRHQFTAVHSPQSNASERVNRSINEALRSFIRNDQRQWDEYIASINCAIRSSVHQTTGRTPYELVFGQTMINHGQDYAILRNLELLTELCSKLDRQDNFTLLRDSIMQNIKDAYDRNVKSYNLRSRKREFNVGQEVIRRNFVQSSSSNNFNAKLAPTGIKAIVKERIGKVNYKLEDLNGGNSGVYHIKDIWT